MLERSSELIKKGTVERILSGKPQEIQIYLFDHQLILCRKVRKMNCTTMVLCRVYSPRYSLWQNIDPRI